MTLMYLKKKTTTDENIATKVGNEVAQDSLDLKPGIANVFKFMMQDDARRKTSTSGLSIKGRNKSNTSCKKGKCGRNLRK